MAFVPISIDKYIKLHLKNNPKDNRKEVRQGLEEALKSFRKGEKCTCGNDIWVIGSAFVGNSCFTCITGESHPTDDYELDIALKKRESTKGRRHIDDIDPTKIAGFFDDDGYEINTDKIKKPSICLICKKNDDPNEEFLCEMTRYDQRDDLGFKCYAFKKI